MANSSYKSLAQKNGVVNRMVAADELPRFTAACKLTEDVKVEAHFRLDDQGRICVAAEISSRIDVDCHLCNESVVWPLSMAFKALVAFDEQQANEWTERSSASSSEVEHIIVAAGQHLDVAELIEDELILGLPRQVCFDEKCANMPELRFVDKDGKATEDLPSDRQLPFQGLRELVANNGLEKDRGDQEID